MLKEVMLKTTSFYGNSYDSTKTRLIRDGSNEVVTPCTPYFSLLTLFSLLIYIFCGRGLKGRAGCRQTEVQTDKQTDRRSLSPTPKNWRTTKNRQRTGSTNSGAYYIPVLTPDAVSRPAVSIARPTASIARPTASLPLCPCNYGRGLVIYA